MDEGTVLEILSCTQTARVNLALIYMKRRIATSVAASIAR
jgi:hypothetical protein